MNLHELTGYESGVVIYTPEGAMMGGFVCNWSAVNGLPRIFVTGVIGFGDGDDLEPVDVADVSQDVVDMAVQLAQEEGDEDPKIDKVWRNEGALVITFQGWN